MLAEKIISASKFLILILFICTIIYPNIAAAQGSTYRKLQTPFYDPNGSQTTSCGSASLIGSENAEKVFNFFRGKGMEAWQAAGIIGNMTAESGVEPQRLQGTPIDVKTPAESFSGSLGWGIVQWTPGSKFIDTINPISKANELGVQLEFLWKQLEGKGPLPEKQAGDELKRTTDVESATVAFQGTEPGGTVQYEGKSYGPYTGFERPADKQGSIAFRIDTAKSIFAKYGSNDGGGAAECVLGGSLGISGDCQANGIVYEGQYTQQQLRKIFGPPVRDTKVNLVNIDFFGSKIPVHKLVAPCLKAIEQELIAKNVSYRPEALKGGFWCIRENDGQIGDSSYHVYGAGCDINPLTNNYFSDGKARPYTPNCPIATGVIDSGNCYDLPPDYVSTFEKYGFAWGGNYSSIKDYMHFEWHGVKP